MKFILDNKVYDTENSDEILTYSASYPFNILGNTIYRSRETVLYKTKKGNWFSVAKIAEGRHEAFIKNENNVKRIFRNLGEVEKYACHFKKLEEA